MEEPDGDEIEVLRIRPRPSEPVTVTMPSDVVAAMREIAAERDTTLEALIRFYIGQSLRTESHPSLTRMFRQRFSRSDDPS